MSSENCTMARKRKSGKKLKTNVKKSKINHQIIEKIENPNVSYECQICQMILTNGNNCILHCGHVFHADCVMKQVRFATGLVSCEAPNCATPITFWDPSRLSINRLVFFEQFGIDLNPALSLEKFPNFGSFRENVMRQIFDDFPMNLLEKERPIT